MIGRAHPCDLISDYDITYKRCTGAVCEMQSTARLGYIPADGVGNQHRVRARIEEQPATDPGLVVADRAPGHRRPRTPIEVQPASLRPCGRVGQEDALLNGDVVAVLHEQPGATVVREMVVHDRGVVAVPHVQSAPLPA